MTLEQAINKYLDSLGTSRWGEGFTLTRSDTKAKAVAAIKKVILGVMEYDPEDYS